MLELALTLLLHSGSVQAACKIPSAAQLTAKTKTIYVIRILGRLEGSDRVAYRAEVLKTIKGARVDEFAFDLRPPYAKFPKDKFEIKVTPACQTRANLVVQGKYIFYLNSINGPNSIIPIQSMDDTAIDKVQELVRAK